MGILVRVFGSIGRSLACAVAGIVVAFGSPAPAIAQAPSTPASQPPAAPAAAPSAFRLADVRLTGVGALDAGELDPLVQPYRGRDVTLADLQALARAVTDVYRTRGYFLAEAIVPVQKVQGGIVEISVVEGRLGKVQVSVAPDAPIGEARVREFLAGLPVGEAVNAAAYERVMLLLSDQPGIKVSSGLRQGVAPGSVDLEVEVAAASRWNFTVEADNHGTREVGRWRLGGTARWNSPAGIGDNLDIRAMLSDESLVFGRLAYELPLGGSGMRAGFGVARVQYDIGGDFEVLDARGKADVVDVSLNYPLIRQRNHNLFIRVALESKRLTDEYRAVELDLGKRVDAIGVGWAWERRDDWLGGGYLASNGTLYRGRLHIGDEQAREADAAPGGLHTAGGFTRLPLQFSRLQAIVPGHALYYSIGGQLASRNLDSSEKLVLGGARAVRAYAASEALVDRGWIQTLEWRWSAGDRWTPYLFYDAARGRQVEQPPLSDSGNSVSLRGAGIGLAWGRPGDFSVNATLAWRAGTRRAQTDGGDRNPRFFIQLQKAL